MNDKKIIIGCDHAGFEYKNMLKVHLEKEGYTVEDAGTYSAESCDYPVPVHALCKKIQSGEYTRGILICGTGIGVSIAANKHKGIRAAVCSDDYSVEMTRKHNDANVLCMGARVLPFFRVIELTEIFLRTDALAEERHVRRQRMIAELEDGTFDSKDYE